MGCPSPLRHPRLQEGCTLEFGLYLTIEHTEKKGMWGDWAAKNMNHGADVFNWPPTCHLQLSPFLFYQNYKQFTLPDSFAANSGHVTQVWPIQCKDNCWARLPVRLFKRHAPLTYIRQLNFFFEKYQKYYMPGGYVSFDHLSNLAFYPPLLSCYQFDVPPSRPFQAPCTLTYVFMCVCVCMCVWYFILCCVRCCTNGLRLWLSFCNFFFIQQYTVERFPCHTYRTTSFSLPAS